RATTIVTLIYNSALFILLAKIVAVKVLVTQLAGIWHIYISKLTTRQLFYFSTVILYPGHTAQASLIADWCNGNQPRTLHGWFTIHAKHSLPIGSSFEELVNVFRSFNFYSIYG